MLGPGHGSKWGLSCCCLHDVPTSWRLLFPLPSHWQGLEWGPLTWWVRAGSLGKMEARGAWSGV